MRVQLYLRGLASALSQIPGFMSDRTRVLAREAMLYMAYPVGNRRPGQ